jgi:MFS family permease
MIPMPTGALWRESEFMKLWAAQAVSAFGSRISRTALPVIAIVTLGASPDQLGVLAAATTAPALLVGLCAGGVVDRSRKRPILIGCDLARAALLLTIPIAAWFGLLGMAQLWIVGGLAGAATTLFAIADNAYLPALVGTPHLVEGNAKLEATDSVAEIGGPGLAGILIDLVTAPVAIVLDALSFLWSAAMLGLIRKTEVPAAAGERVDVLSDLRQGVRAGFGHPLVRPLVLADGTTALFFGFLHTLYMLYGLQVLGLSPGALGLIIGVGGLGGLTGALLAPLLARRLGYGPAIPAAMAVGLLGGLFIPLAGGSQAWSIAALVLQQFIGDALLVAYTILAVSLRQTVLPLAMLGRVNGLIQVLTGTVQALGALIAGPVAGAMGVRGAIWIAVLAPLALAPAILARPALMRLSALPQPHSDGSGGHTVAPS